MCAVSVAKQGNAQPSYISRIVSEVETHGIDIAPPDYKGWLSLSFALADDCAEEDRSYYHR